MNERIAIVGSRVERPESVRFYNAVHAYLEDIDRSAVIVSGGCPDSPDEYAERIWLGTGGAVAIHPVRPEDVKKHGSFGKAAFMRNIDIVDDCTRLVAFWDGVSKGTKHSIDLALKAHKNVEVYFPSFEAVPS